MPPLTFHQFLWGPDAEREPSRWPPVLAFLAALAVLAIGQLVPVVAVGTLYLGDWLAGGDSSSGAAAIRIGTLFEQYGLVLLLVSQVIFALCAWWLAGRYGQQPRDGLALVPPAAGLRAFLFSFAVFVPLLVLLNGVTYTFARENFLADFRAFQGIVQGPKPLLAFLAIGVGAPVWEEMLFRGFLLPPLAKVVGFWPAAAFVSIAWTALHLTYSITGLVEVFLIGLFFAWLYRRTGSLWVPMLCHATYNSFLFLLMRALPV